MTVDARDEAEGGRWSGIADYLLSHAPDDAVAFIDGTDRHSYGELRDAVATLASRLGELSYPRGTPVALLGPNSLFWIAAYIATIDVGYVSVPLPAGLPVEEVVARSQWVGARAIFVDGPPARSLPPHVPDDIAVLTTSMREHVVPWSERPPAADGLDDDAAYLFTSGTTGAARAVRLTQGNLRANTESILGYLPLVPSDRVLVLLPFTYVFGASLLHTHLRVGATLVNQRSTAYPETTVNLLEEHQCTVLAGVPSVFHTLLRNSTFARRDLPRLRIIQQAGGRLPSALLRELSTAHPGARVFVMYGQTEATARLSALDPDQLRARPGSIGRGIPGVSLRVVDEFGNPVRPGEVGEIRARGANISPGYLGDPEATRLRMGDGELRTGDLATVDDEGYIYVVDRAEDFIKSWGYRVSSQEVEAAAMELDELVAAAAVGVTDAVAGERIELVVVVRPGAHVAEGEVIAHCRSILPKYAVPAGVHIVDRLPVNDNGKVVKRDLRARLADRRTEEESRG